MPCKFWAATGHFLFSSEMKISMELAKSCCRPKQRPSLRSIFLSVIGLQVQIWPGNKTACSEWNPVQSSRSELTTCLRKGSLLRFKLKSTATSKGLAQKLGIDVRRDSESIATKVHSQISCKWNAVFESQMQWPGLTHNLTGQASIFNLKIFWAICLCKQLSTVLLINHQLLDLRDLS